MSVLLIIFLVITVTQIIFLGSVIFLENRDPSKTIIWLLILGILPVLGAVLYWVFGRMARQPKRYGHKQGQRQKIEDLLTERQDRPENEEEVRNQALPLNSKLTRLIFNDVFAPLTANNRSEVLTNGRETFKALFAAIEAAAEHIHLEYYIFNDDEIGHEVINLLLRKASQGVKVRILLDGLGGRAVAKRFRELRTAGVEAEWFYPVRFPFLSSKLNQRNHRKIVVVDGRTGFIGGLNVGDEYLSRSKKYGFWRDTFLKLEGDCVHFLQQIFLNDWNGATHQSISDQTYYPKPQRVGDELMQIAVGGPDADWESMLQIFFVALTGAEKKIYIETPYFIPDESALMALKTAALSGLDVRIIFQGVPDHQITYWASHSYFEELLEAGVRIHRYEKGILHAKILILDGEIGSVGSSNFDVRSFRLNFEISAFIYDRKFAQRLEQDFNQDLQDSEEILLEDYKRRPLSNRIKESSARLFSPLL